MRSSKELKSLIKGNNELTLLIPVTKAAFRKALPVVFPLMYEYMVLYKMDKSHPFLNSFVKISLT